MMDFLVFTNFTKASSLTDRLTVTEARINIAVKSLIGTFNDVFVACSELTFFP